MRAAHLAAAVGVLFAVTACDNMQHQENTRTMEPSEHFADGSSARRPPVHAIIRSGPAADSAHPLIPLKRADLYRGQDLFDADCAPCHGRDGYGRGIVVRRGFPPPPSLHDERMRAETDSRLFAVITSGWGVMYPMSDRIAPEDRWAVVAYVRALQRSQHARLADLPAVERGRLALP